MKAEWQQIKDYVNASFNCIEVAKIYEIDYKTQTVSVKLFSKDRLYKSDIPYEGDEIELAGIPFVVISGGAAALEMPIAVGDDCILFFNDTDCSSWIETGIGYVDIQDERHTRASAFALIGAKSIIDANAEYSQINVVLKNGQNAKITLAPDNISIEMGNYAIIVSSTGVNIKNVSEDVDLSAALNALMAALDGAVDTSGNSFNNATKANLNAVKVQFNKVIG